VNDDYIFFERRPVMNVKDLFDLSGKVALVTGGTRGLGLEMAKGLAEAGADLIICSVDPPAQMEEATNQLQKTGRRIFACSMNVTLREDVTKTVQEAKKRFGRIDILINSAGINDVHEIAPKGLEAWEKIMAVNITGTYLCAGAVAEIMKSQQSGSIINMGSIYGLLGLDRSLYIDDPSTLFEFPAYHASKGAVVNLTRDLATNLGRFNIRANCICPATFVTDQNRHILVGNTLDKINKRTPLGRVGGEDDLKGVAVFLASEASRYVTGHVLAVDGGWTAW
jgi:NAD(P)-dependent dehydrogenase (short-subunit alcohol dehydrogenase family)